MFSRCYATISDLIYDFTGLDIPLPIFSYGFFIALAFLAAAFFLSLELKRKEQEGILNPFYKNVTVGAPASAGDLIINALIGFVLGFKLVFILFNYPEFAASPQDIIMSGEGNLIGGIVGGLLLAFFKYREKQKTKLDEPVTEKVQVYPHQAVGDMVIIAAVSGIIGAKLFYLFETPGNFEAFLEDPLGSFFGGLTVYGGLILGAIAVLWYAKKKGMKPIHIADAAAPTLFISYAFGRYGCQVSGDGDWGIVNTMDKPGWLSWLPDKFWAFDYPHNILNDGAFIEGCKEAHCYVLEQPVFPTPVYECVMTVLLFLFLWGIRKRITIPGLMFSLYFIFNGIERFFIEKIRVNTKFDIFGIQSTQAEVIAVIFVLVGIIGAIYFTRKHNKEIAVSN